MNAIWFLLLFLNRDSILKKTRKLHSRNSKDDSFMMTFILNVLNVWQQNIITTIDYFQLLHLLKKKVNFSVTNDYWKCFDIWKSSWNKKRYFLWNNSYMHKVEKLLEVQKCFGNINVINSFNRCNHEKCFILFDYFIIHVYERRYI